MSGTEQTFNVTSEDVRKQQQKESAAHGGQIPADSDTAALQSIVDSAEDKAATIDERKANLPLPEQPPVASDFNSADASTVNVGSGRDVAQPMNKGDNTEGGRQAQDGLSGLPNDAVTREAKGKAGLENTTN